MEGKKLKKWTEFTYLLRSSYRAIAKGSIVNVNGEQYMIKRIDRIILLDEAVKEPNTVQIFARGIKLD